MEVAMRPTLVFVLFLAAACGTESKKSGGGDSAPEQPAPADPQQQVQQQDPAPESPVPYSLAVATATALPPCDEAHNQQLVYVMDTKQFQTCQGGAWQVVEITAAAPKPSGQEIYNKLQTIVPDQMLDDMRPEVRAVLLSDLFKPETRTFRCGGDATMYVGGKIDTGDHTYEFSILVQAGRVDAIYTYTDGATDSAAANSDKSCADLGL
jgi:hypothetical protein